MHLIHTAAYYAVEPWWNNIGLPDIYRKLYMTYFPIHPVFVKTRGYLYPDVVSIFLFLSSVVHVHGAC